MTTPPFDTSRFPGGDLDPEMVDDAAVLLEVRAVQVRSQGRWVVDVWSGLRECYQAPEAGQLYAVMGPVGKLSGDFADDVGVVAEALHSPSRHRLRTSGRGVRRRSSTGSTRTLRAQ